MAKSARSRKSSATSTAKSAPKSAARSTAKTNARAASKPASRSAVSAGAARVGRGTRWTDEQVALLMETVRKSPTAKQAFEKVSRELGKSSGTVQQKYYNLQKKASGGGTGRRRGRPPGSGRASGAAVAAVAGRGGAPRAMSGGSLPGASDLRALTIDDLVGLAQRVKTEVDRRKKELDAAAKLFG